MAAEISKPSVRGGNFGREIMERERRPCGAQPEGRAGVLDLWSVVGVLAAVHLHESCDFDLVAVYEYLFHASTVAQALAYIA